MKNRFFLSVLSALIIGGIVVPYIPVIATTCATSGNNVTIASNCIFDAGTYTFTGTLTINAGVTVTAASNVGSGQVVIISDNITVNGTISGIGTGFGASAGPGAGETSSTSGGGGGYGGNGGDGGAGSSAGGAPYGSVTQPTDLGSGGGNDLNNGGSGGSGGGSVKLQLGGAGTGTITITGAVSVNGTGGTINDTGGGSGGSVWIDAPNGTVTGTGTVSANGGAAVLIEGGGGGAGGRVAVYYSGTAPTFAIQAFGNAGSTQSGFAGEAGGAGTIYMKSAAQTNGDLILDNTNRDGANTTQIAPSSQTYDNITVKRLAKYVIPNGFTTMLASGGALTGAATAGRITTSLGGTLSGPSSLTISNLNFTNNGDISGVTSLTIGSGSNFTQTTATGTFSSGLANMTVASGGTYTASGTSTFSVSSTLTVQSGGLLTHNDNSTARSNVLDISAANIDIQSGGSINLDSKGFDTNQGPGKGTTAANSGGGAGYGGNGGNGGNGAGSAGGEPYGSLSAPTDIGSGGASDESAVGSSGGGFGKFVVSGTFTNNGTISANGAAVPVVADGGAGSGGGFDVTAGTLSGTGTIRVNGGAADANNGGGGGAGGRIAIKYTSGVPTSYALQAFGGAGGNQSSFSGEDGGAGTIYLKSAAQANGDIIVKNNNNNTSAFTTQIGAATQTFDNITVADGAEYRILSGSTLVLAPGGTMTGGGSVQGFIQIDSGAMFEPNVSTFTLGNNSKIINNGTVPTVTDLTVTTGATFIHNTSTGSFSATLTDLTIGNAATFSVSQSNVLSVPTITVQSGGTLTHEANGSAQTHILHVAATTIDVQTGGTVSANAKGFSGSNGTGQGTDGSEAGGAGYGGDGGNADSGTAGGVTYGDVKQPALLGSGGGDDSITGQQGGAGGGLVRLVVSGTLTIAGTISANGGNALANEGGGGSGGSVWLDTDAIAGSGTVTANGGAGSPFTNTTIGGGGGGGGRISITFNSGSAGGARQAFGGNRGGNTGAVGGAGGAGTIFTDDKDDAFPNGDLVVDNNNNAGIAASSETTQVTTASQTYDNLTIRNGARYVVPSAMTLTVASGGAFTGGGATQPLITVNSGGTFNLPNATQTVSGISVTNNGTVGVVTDLTLSDSTFTHNGTFALTVTNLSFLTTASTFIHNGTNLDDQDLVVNNSGTFVLQTAAAFSINSLLVESTGIYEHRRLGAATITTVTVNSGGTLTHTANGSSKIYELHISSTAIDLQTGSTVSANAKGFSASNGTGQGTDAAEGGGAGHGGDGGNADAGAAGGITYGDPKQPITLGSGGGDDTITGQQGGAGGGAVRLEATGTITVAGTISANGANAVANEGGGGAGGSVWIDAGTVAGAGSITANGGAGSPFTVTTIGGGGGGGGRISITFNANTASGARQAFGGNRGGTTNAVGGAGGAGTIYFDDKDDAFPNGDLVIDNNNNAGIAASSETTQVTTASQTYDNLTIRNGARYVVPSAMTLTVASGGAFTGGGATQPLITVNSGGTFNLPNATQTVSGISVTNNGTVGVVTDLTLSDSTFTHNGTFALTVTNLSFLTTASTFIHNGTNLDDQDLVVNNSGTFVLQTAAAFSINSLLVESTGTYEHRRLGAANITTVTVSGGTMTHTANGASKIYELHISATTIDIQAGSTVSASAKGFSASNGTGQGADASEAGGAGHGGDGGNADTGTAGGVTYGDVKQPVTLGSGGGDDSITGQQGGAGGGAIRLEATGTITVASTIQANGANAVANEGGGGAGGSVWLDANTIAGAGSITANGGAGSPFTATTIGGGGGGGGRISITFNANTASGARQAFGGNRGGTTGGSVAGAGGAGTIYFDDKDDAFPNGDLVVDNNNNAGIAASSETTQVTTASQTYDNVTTKNGARYVIPSTMTLTVAPGGTFTGGGSSQPVFTIASGGTFDPSQASLTLTSVNIVNNGTVGTATSLILNDSTFQHNGTFSATLSSMTLQTTGTFVMQTISGLQLSTMTVQSGGTFEQRMVGAVTVGTVTVQSGGNLTHTANTTSKTSELNISATDLDLQSGSTVNVSSKGFSGSEGTGQGADGTTGGGGGHCAAGGNGSTPGVGGAAYGTATAPTTLGSGGGDDSTTGQQAGAGGGTIRFDVSGTLTVEGTITANGAAGIANEGGGGAGGAIWLAVGTWAGSVDITANGGNGFGSSAGGGGGGAGYIRAEYVTKTYAGTLTSNGGAKGGTGAATAGGNCTPSEVSGNNPTPSTTSISPTTKTAGDATFTLTVNGANFIASSVVRFSGADRATSFVNANQVTAQILASDIATGGAYNVTVFNPGPGGGTSNAQVLNVNNPVPTTTSISPTTKSVGDADFTLTVNGTNFVSTSVVRFAGSGRATTFVSSTQLTATILESDMTSTGTFNITVFNPTPGGGTSNAQTFTVNNPVPATTSIDPVEKNLGDEEFIMTVNGSSFVTNSVVRFNGANRTTTFVDNTMLEATIPASDMTSTGTFNITVFNPTPGGGTSNAQTFTVTQVDNPVPTTTDISPTSKTVGSGTFTMTVNGTDFIPSSVVRFDGSNRTTTFVDDTQLTATIPASDLTIEGAFNITVFNPTPGGGESEPQSFTVTEADNPVPTTTSISPASKTIGDGAFTMTVDGTNFVASSVVRFNGSDRTTTFVNATQLTADIPSSDLTTAGTFTITVFNPTPGGGSSNGQTFTVNNPVPTTTSIGPDTKSAGEASFTLTVNGTNFISTSVVRFNGSNRTTTFVNATQLTASIPSSDIATGGSFPITVFNPTPGGGTSNAQTLTVNNPVPTTTSISPTSKFQGESGFTLTVNGTNFVSTSIVRFDGSNRTTTFVNATQLTAAIPSTDLANPGTFVITVVNPTPGGGTSNGQTFTVNPGTNPVPTTTSISPTSKTVGESDFTMTVDGTSFVSTSVVRFNGADRTTTFVNASQLTADIPSSDLTTPGSFSITVFNPAPGGGTSNAQTFSVVSTTPTTGNRVVLSRLKVGEVATADIAFVLNSTLSSPLTVTFPAGFTVLSAATGGSACLSNFGFTASTLTASKTNCSGSIIMTGATVQNPATPGAYTITWVNDEPGSATVFITSDDQAQVSATIEPTITFNVGSQAAATACDGTFSGNGGSVPLGTLTLGSVSTSDTASIPHICARLTTDASSGAAVSVRSANGALASLSAPADTIASSTATLTPGTAGYGLCAGSAGGDAGKTDPAGGPASASPVRTAPFNGSCSTGSHSVGGLSTSFQDIWSVAAPSLNAFARIYVKASISPSTPAHADYTDTLTFIVTGTY